MTVCRSGEGEGSRSCEISDSLLLRDQPTFRSGLSRDRRPNREDDWRSVAAACESFSVLLLPLLLSDIQDGLLCCAHDIKCNASEQESLQFRLARV